MSLDAKGKCWCNSISVFLEIGSGSVCRSRGRECNDVNCV